MQNDIYKLTIKEARTLLDAREVSSVELTKSFIDRIDSVESRVRAFVRVTPEVAIEQAERADLAISQGHSSLMTGIPLQIKDNMCTKGIVTTCSSIMLRDFVPPYSATVVDRLESENAVVIGKGNMDEFAMGSSTENSAFHSTHNPWDLERVPGGSSGGPAASVSASESMAALGSDTGGSIRQPAALCGVVGMKPTYGLVSRYGLVAFASSLDQIGPITRDVTDSAMLLTAISGHDPKDSTSIPVPKQDFTKALDKGIKGMKIGVPKEYFVDGIDSEVDQATREAIEVLQSLGASVDWEVSLPSTEYALAVYYIIAPSECSANLARYDGVKYGYSDQSSESMWAELENTRQQGFGPEVKRRIMLGTYSLSAGYYDAYYLKALKVRTLISEEFSEAFKKYDVLVTPTSPTPAFKIGEKTADPLQMYLSDVLTIPVNIAGLPGISVQCGFSQGLPVGLQIIGPQMGDATILRVAHAYEQASEWHKLRPEI